MNISIGPTDYISFHGSGIRLRNSVDNMYPPDGWGFLETKRYEIQGSKFFECNILHKEASEYPFYQFGFAEGTRLLGFSRTSDTIIPDFEDQLLSCSAIWQNTNSTYKRYLSGTGYRKFSYEGQGIVLLGLEENFDWTRADGIINDIYNSDADIFLKCVSELSKLVLGVLITSSSYERVYLVTSNYADVRDWIRKVCNCCRLEFREVRSYDFP